jgi:hypothetical protein
VITGRARSPRDRANTPLGAASRNELRTDQADDLAEIERLAKTLASGGFTVWIYDHGNDAVCAGGSNFRTILRYGPPGSASG